MDRYGGAYIKIHGLCSGDASWVAMECDPDEVNEGDEGPQEGDNAADSYWGKIEDGDIYRRCGYGETPQAAIDDFLAVEGK